MNKLVLLLTFAILIIMSCNSSKTDEKKVNDDIEKDLEFESELTNGFNKAKQIFYALPSPVETAMLLKRAGVNYNEAILNPTENIDKYTTSASKALNFGVYGADLSYASMFSQTQTAIKYMATSKKLAEQLGITDFINKDVIDRLERNVNNRDSAMQIITDGFVNSNTYLKENGRTEIAVLLLSGGWIEGLYIATSLAKETPDNTELVERIIDQKLSLITLIALLKEHKDNKDIANVLSMTNEVKNIYDKVQIVTSKVEPVVDKNNEVTTLQATSEIFVSDEIFNELCTKVDSIRNSITINQ